MNEVAYQCLKGAKEYGLDFEVAVQAVQEMRDNPLLSVDEAFTLAYYEWVK